VNLPKKNLKFIKCTFSNYAKEEALLVSCNTSERDVHRKREGKSQKKTLPLQDMIQTATETTTTTTQSDADSKLILHTTAITAAAHVDDAHGYCV